MSQITVTNVQGQTSGGNANKVIITSGHTLEVTSNSTIGGSLTAPDIRGTAIKSSNGTAAMTIASGGQVTFSQTPVGTFGKVLQVKQLIVAKSTLSNGTTSFVSTGSSLSITPAATSSKIMIEVRGGAGHCPYVNQTLIGTVYRDSTNLSTTGLESIGNSTTGLAMSPHNIAFLDSPNTTSSVTYTPYYKSHTAKADCYWNLGGAVGSDWSITLTEIGA